MVVFMHYSITFFLHVKQMFSTCKANFSTCKANVSENIFLKEESDGSKYIVST